MKTLIICLLLIHNSLVIVHCFPTPNPRYEEEKNNFMKIFVIILVVILCVIVSIVCLAGCVVFAIVCLCSKELNKSKAAPNRSTNFYVIEPNQTTDQNNTMTATTVNPTQPTDPCNTSQTVFEQNVNEKKKIEQKFRNNDNYNKTKISFEPKGKTDRKVVSFKDYKL